MTAAWTLSGRCKLAALSRCAGRMPQAEHGEAACQCLVYHDYHASPSIFRASETVSKCSAQWRIISHTEMAGGFSRGVLCYWEALCRLGGRPQLEFEFPAGQGELRCSCKQPCIGPPSSEARRDGMSACLPGSIRMSFRIRHCLLMPEIAAHLITGLCTAGAPVAMNAARGHAKRAACRAIIR